MNIQDWTVRCDSDKDEENYLVYAPQDFIFRDATTYTYQLLVYYLLRSSRDEFAGWIEQSPPNTDHTAFYYTQWLELQMALRDLWLSNGIALLLIEVLEIGNSPEKILWSKMTASGIPVDLGSPSKQLAERL